MTEHMFGDPPPDPSYDPDFIPPAPATQYEREDGHIIVGSSEEHQALEETIAAQNHPDEEITTLTEEDRRNMRSVFTYGKRTKSVVICDDHPAVVRTLTGSDELRIGKFTQEYLQTNMFHRAYSIAVCAAAVVEIEGKPLYTSLTEKPDPSVAYQKAAEKVAEWTPAVIDEVYRHIVELEAEFAEFKEQLGKSNG